MTEPRPDAGADRQLMICSSLAPGSFVRRRGTTHLNSPAAWRSLEPEHYLGRVYPDPDTAIVLPEGTHLVLWVETRYENGTSVRRDLALVLLLLSGGRGFAYAYAQSLVPIVATGRSA